MYIVEFTHAYTTECHDYSLLEDEYSYMSLFTVDEATKIFKLSRSE